MKVWSDGFHEEKPGKLKQFFRLLLDDPFTMAWYRASIVFLVPALLWVIFTYMTS